MKKNIELVLLGILLSTFSVFARHSYELLSPEKLLRVQVEINDSIAFSLFFDGHPIFENNCISLALRNNTFGLNSYVKNVERKSIHKVLKPVLPLKFSTINNDYNLLSISFKNGSTLEFRAYDDGLAYRFITDMPDSVDVLSEQLHLNFASSYKLHLQVPSGFKTAYEEPYTHLSSNEWGRMDKFSTLPVLIEMPHSRVLISESNVSDYPCMFLRGVTNGLSAVFPKLPVEFGEDGDRSLKILKEADFIAKTIGRRNYPWRYFVVVNDDKALLENSMSYKLAEENQIKDISWIKPGQVSWEWWNGCAPYGEDVNFKTGCNTETYQYYIDFASQFGIPYIILDEGWSKNTTDPFNSNPDIDILRLIRYGQKKNVGIILWLTWLTVDKHMDLFKTYSSWGVKGVKIDFMDRSDQYMMNFYEKVAKEAAKYKLFVDFHGAITPKGLEYKYPNILSYEGVRGLEQMGGCTPDNTIYLPFIRNVVGAMDFTPGAMINMQPDAYCSRRPNSAGIGTRAYHMALFTIFESGLQMLCDNPTLYYLNKECTDFISKVPVTWDETVPLEATLGEMLIIAKRNGNKWYLGGITNGKERNVKVKFSFLEPQKRYKMVSYEDGPNASKQAMDYRRRVESVTSDTEYQVAMSPNGGWTAMIEEYQ
jgi:alpha-glucosidase